MIKKFMLTMAVVFAFVFSMQAQLDVSVNPLGLLFGSYDVSVEKGISESFGVELTAGFSSQKYELGEEKVSSSGFGARIMGKYYFSPKNGIDRFNVAPYIKIGSNKFDDGADKVTNFRFAAGVYLGYKIVASSNVFFELGFGLGKAFVNSYKVNGEEILDGGSYPVFNIDATGKLAVGYRF